MAANAAAMRAQAGELPIRIASKSVRSVEVLRRIADLDPGFRGSSPTPAEALFLVERGFDDIVVAYPTVDRAAIARLVELARERPEAAPTLMFGRRGASRPDRVDDGGRADGDPGLPRRRRGTLDRPRRFVRIGPKRSPIHFPAQARRLAADAEARPGTRLDGVMSYEGRSRASATRFPAGRCEAR